MNTHSFLNRTSILTAALALTMSVQAAVTDLSTLPLSTYYAPASVDVKPNILFVLDDSGSMTWPAMPDQAYWDEPGNYSPSPNRFRPGNYLLASNNGMPPYLSRNSAFNGLAYNPAIRYQPPIKYNADGSLNTTSYPSKTSANTAAWTAVPNDGYGVQSTGTSDLSTGVYAYVTVAGEYCDKPDLRTCTAQTVPSATYPNAAPMRWCATAALNTDCRATWDSSRTYPRIPAPRIATLTVSGSGSTSVTGITIPTVAPAPAATMQIMANTAGPQSTNSGLATAIATQINACTNVKTGNCNTVGFSATVSGSDVTLYAPDANTNRPTVTKTPLTSSMTVNPGTFDRSPIPLPYWRDTSVTPNQSSAAIPGENLRHTITPFVTSYTKATGRDDCTGATCTYAEEMANYANWHAYYRTRMQMMKTSASRAFAAMDSAADIAANASRFRVGYMSINNATGSDFLNLNEFKTAHKNAWFTKLFLANPGGGTPLRAALSKAGRLYAGTLTSLNGVTATDPLQYSCQQNFTILSTDGFWNGSAGYKLDGSTAVGNQDGSLPPPYNDGGSTVVQQRTSSLQSQTVTQQAQRGTLQRSTSTLQSSTSTLQSSTSTLQSSTSTLLKSTLTLYQETSSNSGVNWTLPAAVASCTWDNTTSSRTRCSYATTWSTPAAGACTPVSQGTGTSGTWNTAVACSYAAWTTPPAPATTCQPVSQSSGTGAWTPTARTCSYTTPTPVPATTCQPVTQSSGTGNWTVQTARTCSYTTPTPVPATTCQPVAQSSGTGNWTVQTARACSYTTPTPVDATTCVPVAQSSGSGNWTVATAAQCSYRFDPAAATQTCAPAYVANNYTNPTVYSACATSSSGWTNTAPAGCTATTTWSAAGTKTNCQYTGWSGWGTVSSCTPLAQSSGPVYSVGTAAECQNFQQSAGTSDTLADVAAYYYNTDLRKSTATAPDATGTCTGPLKAASTTVHEDLCTDNVPANGRDVAAWQHMTTYTLGLGAQGKMLFSPTYWTDTSGDFNSVATGVTADPGNGVCPWMTSGRCVWPTPASDDPANIDDLWHAAVNGRGSYFSASDPNSLATGLATTLAAIIDTPRPGTAAAAASSNPNISAGDNYVFSSFYKSVDWYGDLYRQRLDTITKDLNPRVDWSAGALVDCATTPWAASTAYVAGSVYRNPANNACYLVTNDYVSQATFGTTDTDNSAVVSSVPAACSTSWAASTSYAVGSTFSQGGTCYYVIKAYTSSTAFGITDTANSNSAYVAGAPTSRTIYTRGGGVRSDFTWAGLTAAQKNYFATAAITYVAGPPATGLSQFCTSGACLGSTAQTSAAGEPLVNYLRGDRTNEAIIPPETLPVFRTRKHVLGDIVSSEARYVKTPQFSYNDPGYSDYKTTQSSRQAAVYVASNDGMLHAFNAETGQELWAYIPEMVLPQLYRLADHNYSQNHRYFVDGTPEVGDVCISNCTDPANAVWKTILVGGLNLGGKGYYALDITDPASPVVLWEFTNAHMGYSYGNPRITKLKTGEWVVLVTSGYNNADGVGSLFVLKAYPVPAVPGGTLIREIRTTGVGSPSDPSGLAKISAYSTTAETDNTTLAVYGGDMLGNLWRFDINGDIGTSGYEAQRLVTFLDGTGTPQPITAKPVETTIEGKPVIYVGTGSYLGVTDVSTTKMQTMYAIKDNLGTTTYSNPRTDTTHFVGQTLVAATCTNEPSCTPGEAIRKISPVTPPIDWATQNGWYVNFLTAGERATTDPALALGTLVFTTNTPNNASVDACGIPGVDSSSSWLYFLDYKTGGPVSTAGGVAATTLGNVIATRPVLVRLPDGTVLAMIRTSSANPTPSGGSGGNLGLQPGFYPGAMDGSGTQLKKPPIAPSGGPSRRVSWREITND